MKRTEVTRLIGICSVNYKNWPEDDPDKFEMLVTLWAKMLEDTPYELAEAAVEKYIAEAKFPPTIADIRERIADITVPQGKTAIEAWGDVLKAIRYHGSYNEPKALASLPTVTRKVVEAMGYRTLCLSENEMADRAHFLKVYETMLKRERDDALMLQSTRDAIQRIQGEEVKRLR